MILDITEATKKDFEMIDVVSHQVDNLIEVYPSWCCRIDGKIYAIGGVLDLDLDFPIVWTFMDKIIYSNKKSFLILVKNIMSKLNDLFPKYGIIVDRKDKRSLRFVYRLGFKNYDAHGDFVRLVWQTH